MMLFQVRVHTMLLCLFIPTCIDALLSLLAASANPRLPEPPALRERLIQEVRFFVEHLRQKSVESGRLISFPDLDLGISLIPRPGGMWFQL